MRPAFLSLALTFLLLLGPLRAQGQDLPIDRIPEAYRAEVRDIVKRPHFDFQTRTQPKRVRVATMEKIFDHPRLGLALWRHCGFVPSFQGFVENAETWSLDDGRGLRGTLHLIYRAPGHRIYLVEGEVDKGRLKINPHVKASMLTSYRYWEEKGQFVSHLRTWTLLDSSVLGFFAGPFKGYLRARQDEFIGYINSNIAQMGEFSDRHPADFRLGLRQDGDPVAQAEFEQLFGRR
jgi:hypothetical protein